MKLIDLLVQELPKRGGWPIGMKYCCQSTADSEIYFSKVSKGAADFTFYPSRNMRSEESIEGRYSYLTREQYEAALAASQQPAWNGEVLPPIGTECEVNRAGDWMRCRIEFISGMHVVMKMAGSEVCWQTCACTFRPIRTEAERRRESICDAIYGALTKAEREHNRSDEAEALYDAIAAGKIPGVKLED